MAHHWRRRQSRDPGWKKIMECLIIVGLNIHTKGKLPQPYREKAIPINTCKDVMNAEP